ncbi:MAG: T9SS type A sorting domain-containing protein [Bacteroidales bacterium]
MNYTFAQPYEFQLAPSGTTTDFMKFVPKGFTYNGTNYVTGYLTLSAYMNVATQQYTDPGIPVQKIQLQGGNILLCRTNFAPGSPDLNPTSRNGAILFSDMVTTSNDWIHGKWGIEYDDQYSAGGLNFFKPVSSLTASRINFSLFMSNSGNIGIGTGEPLAKLQVADGDIFIQDINKGIIMKSPDGSCWRGTMNNSGQLEFIKLADCENLTTKINEEIENSSIKVYPNPSKEYFEVKCSAIDCMKYKTISIYGTSGNLVFSQPFNSETTIISTSKFKSGSYILKLHGGKESFTDTVVITH